MNQLEIDHEIHVRYAKERLQAGVSPDDLKMEMLKLYRESKGFFMWAHFGQTPTQYPGNKNELVFRNLIKRAQTELGHTPQTQQQQQPRRDDDLGDDWEQRLAFIKSHCRSQSGLPVDDLPPRQSQQQRTPAPQKQPQAEDKSWEERLQFIRENAEAICRGV